MLTKHRVTFPNYTGNARADFEALKKAMQDYFLALESAQMLKIEKASIDSSPIGANSASTGAFTTLTGSTSVAGGTGSFTDLTTTGNNILGNAQADTLNVGNGDIIKDALGRTGFGGSPNQKVDVIGTGTTYVRVKSSTTGTTNEGGLILERGDQASGYAQASHYTGATLVFAVGLRAGDADYHFFGNAAEFGKISSTGNFIWATGALSTSATDGFIYTPGCAGTPTGTPTSVTGRVPFVYDTTNGKWYAYNGAWLASPGKVINASTAAQSSGGFATDTYLTNSDLKIPTTVGMKAGMMIKWEISASKTNAGIATPVFSIRIGSNKSTSDTSRLAITGTAQTAATDQGIWTVMVTVRSVSATGVIQGTIAVKHNQPAGGFANNDAGVVEATSGTFDNTSLGGQFIGLSINGGTSAAWTITQVHAEMTW